MSKKRILVVDDVQENVELLIELLSDRYDIMVALDGKSALELAHEELPDLILLDIMMPNMSGYTVCEKLKKNPITTSIPIIFLTAKDDEESIEEAFSIGGADYISKPFKVKELFVRIERELRMQALISNLEESQKKLEELSWTDPLTKLYNRRCILKSASQILELSKRNQTSTSIMMIDIDDFKKVNDTYGHNIGDDVLVSFAKLLKKQSRKSDVVCRWGGEEFLILLPETELEGAVVIAQKLREALKHLAVRVDEMRVVRFSVSIGLSLVNASALDIESALIRADKELYKAKNSGKDRVSVAEADLE